VKLLVDRGAEINIANKFGQTPLQTAADACSPEVVKFLIDKGAEVNTMNFYNSTSTPLHTAAGWWCLESVQHLLKAGADQNIKDNAGRTPLDIAKEFIRSETDNGRKEQRSKIIQLLSQ
jgi:ankyrin repeat protein